MRTSASILLLRFHALFPLRLIASVLLLNCLSPKWGFSFSLVDFHWPALNSQVATTIPILIFAAGGPFKKLSDSFGSNNSFQGDLEERKCDINLTQIPNFFFLLKFLDSCCITSLNGIQNSVPQKALLTLLTPNPSDYCLKKNFFFGQSDSIKELDVRYAFLH